MVAPSIYLPTKFLKVAAFPEQGIWTLDACEQLGYDICNS